MRLLTIAALGMLIVASSLHAQAPDTLWTKSYGALGGALAVSVVPAPGGGYFVVGTIYYDSVRDTNGWRNSDFWILRLDEQGDTLWTRSYGDPLWSEGIAQLTATADGGFVIAGDRQRHQADDLMYVVKADAEGEPQWEATYPTDRSHCFVVGIDQMVSNNFILAFNTIGSAEDFAVMRIYGGWGDDLEGAGGEEFRIPYPWALREWAGAVTATSDKGFAVCGWTTSQSILFQELFLLKSNEYGIVEWTRIYDSPGASEPRGVKQTQDGGFIIVGKAGEPINSDARGLYLLKTNANGDKIWSRSYEGPAGLDVIELPDGGFLATGWAGFTTRVSASGEQMWSESYSFGRGPTFSAALSPDGGYVLAGWILTPEDDLEVYIVKLAPDRIPTAVDDDVTDLLPAGVALAQNYPNPFNPNTTIEFELPRRSRVKIEVFNLLGQRVRTLLDESKPAGSHRIEWAGTDNAGKPVATGVYLYRLEADDVVETRKMLVLK